jgi:hypothetical protein
MGIFSFSWGPFLHLPAGKDKIIQDQYGIRQEGLLKITLKKPIGRIGDTTQDKQDLYPSHNAYHRISSGAFLFHGDAICGTVIVSYNTNALKRPTVSRSHKRGPSQDR